MRFSIAPLFFFSSSVLLALGGCSSAPAPSGGDSGTGADSSPPNADSGPQQNDSGLGPPAPASISIQSTCPAITPCGGDPTGTWDYASGCGQVNLDAVKQACSGASVSNVAATVAGRVTFGAGQVYRQYDLKYQATVSIPSTCAQPAGGCSNVQTAIAPSFDTATCSSDGAGGCNCDVTGHEQDAGGTTYTVQSNQIVTADGNRYDFCVQAGTMSYSHVSGSSPEAGSFQLTKR